MVGHILLIIDLATQPIISENFDFFLDSLEQRVILLSQGENTMKLKNNEIQVTINFSDELLQKVTTILLAANSPMPLMALAPQAVAAKKASTSKPIGFHRSAK